MVSTYESGAIAAGEASAIFTGRKWRNTAATPVIYCHHANGLARTAVSPASEADAGIRRIIEGLTAGGLPVIANDQAGASNWGADPAPSRVDGALSRVASVTGARTDRVLLLGDSMGAVLALNWARANPTKVAAVALLVPVVDLQDAHDTAPAPLPANIEAAYGGAVGYQAALLTRNPMPRASEHSWPIRLWYSDDDPTAHAARALAFASAAPDAVAVSMGAVGHTIPATFNVAPVVDFLLTRA